MHFAGNACKNAPLAETRFVELNLEIDLQWKLKENLLISTPRRVASMLLLQFTPCASQKEVDSSHVEFSGHLEHPHPETRSQRDAEPQSPLLV